MRGKRFEWENARDTAKKTREWLEGEVLEEVDASLVGIDRRIERDRDKALFELTKELDGVELDSLRVNPDALVDALDDMDAELRNSMELATHNIRAVADAQVDTKSRTVELPQGQTVEVRSTAVGSAGLYAPGGRAAYPSSVLMCAIPAQAAGVERIAVASPPQPDGKIHPLVLGAAALVGVEEVYALTGVAAIIGLARGTETIPRVDVIAGPGNVWIQEAKRRVFGLVGIDSYAGPSELMIVADSDSDPEWIALDLCAQAEHGEGPLLLASTDAGVLGIVEKVLDEMVSKRPSVGEAALALVPVPSADDAIELANAFAPEHLELLTGQAASLSAQVRTAGCVFIGSCGATAFGDYVAGSNHVLPTMGAGRFSGPLGPDIFRRKIATVEVPAEAAAKLAPHVNRIARAEGFPVHGESAMIRTKS
jgi:histidinol dehydrogenase